MEEKPNLDYLVDSILYNEYWYLMQMSCLYLDMRTPTKKCLSIIYLIFMGCVAIYEIVICVETAIRIPEDNLISSQAIHFLTLEIISLFVIITTNICRNKLEKIHFLMGTNIGAYDAETKQGMENVKNKYKNKKLFLLHLIIIYMIFAGLFTAVLAPAIDNFFASNIREEIYSPGGVPFNLPLPIWSPFGTHTSFGYIISLFMELLCTYCITVVVIAANILLLAVSQFITTELELLMIALKRLPQRTIRLYKIRHNIDTKCHINFKELKYNANFKKCVQQCLKETVIHHQKILQTFHELNGLISIAALVAFFVASITIAISGFLMIFGNGAIGSMATAFILGIGEVLIVLMICWCGEQMRQANEKLSVVLYSVEWYYIKKEVVTYLLIMMIRAQKPLVMIAGRLVPVNFETFSNVMNTAYSYFNLLYASKIDH